MSLSLAGIVLMVVLLSGCQSQQSDVKQAKSPVKDTLVIANDQDVPTLDPGLSNDSTSNRVIFDLFEGLVNQNQANQPIPGVAKSWKVSEDGLKYTFLLRKDAKWSNGKAVTAGDFVYAFRRNAAPKTASPQNYIFALIKNGKAVTEGKLPVEDLGIKALGEYKLEITLAHPAVYFPSVLTLPVTFPLYKPAIDQYGRSWTQPKHMISNGAYTLKEWIVGGHILEQKNPFYWDSKNVAIKYVKVLPTNTLSGYNGYRAGEIDIATPPPGIRLDALKKLFPNEVYSAPYFAIIYYWINVRKPGLDKLEVRKALSMVVNRESIAKNVIAMGQTAAYGIVPDMIQDGIYQYLYKELPSYKWVEMSMEKRIQQARKLLMEAGYSDQHPLRFQLSYNTSEFNKQIALSVMQMWKTAFGNMLRVTLANEEWKVYLNTVNSGNFDVARMGSNADINAPNQYVYQFTCHADSNAGGSCIKTIGEYYQKGLMAKTQRAYNENMAKAMKVAMENYLTIPIDNSQYTVLVKPYIGGYHPDQNYLNDVYSKWFYFKTSRSVKENN